MSGRWNKRCRAIWAAGALLGFSLVMPRGVWAQEKPSVFERLGLDRLQFVSLGASMGWVDPTQVDAARLYAVTADYGEISRNWRIVFDVSYWESEFSDRTVAGFLDTLRNSIVDPTNDYTITQSRISMYDVAFSGSLRFQSGGPVAIRPYAGIGFAAHVLNAEGVLIEGTFVERSLDNIAAGLFGNAGVLFRPWGRVIFEGQARADLLSGFRSLQVRVGAQYLFGPLRTPRR